MTEGFLVDKDVFFTGASGFGGGGGGGAFVEALLNVIPGETLEIVVGAGGAKGQYGGTVQIVREDDPTKFETEEVCGVAKVALAMKRITLNHHNSGLLKYRTMT